MGFFWKSMNIVDGVDLLFGALVPFLRQTKHPPFLRQTKHPCSVWPLSVAGLSLSYLLHKSME